MSFKDAVRSGLDEYLTGLHRALDGLTPEELRWQANADSNHIAWLVWHMARVENGWISRARGTEQIWVTGEWAQKIGFGHDANDSGYGWTMEQVAGMPEVSVDDLLAYYSDVRNRTFAELDEMTDADMSATYTHPRMGDRSIAWIFGHIIVEESQHLGQIAFIRGMQRGLNG